MTSANISVVRYNYEGKATYTCIEGYQISEAAIKNHYRVTNASTISKDKWKVQTKTCTKNVSGEYNLYWKMDFTFDDCRQIYCLKSEFKDNVTELQMLNESLPVGFLLDYYCQDGRILRGECIESKVLHFTTLWNYPNGTCTGMIRHALRIFNNIDIRNILSGYFISIT